MNSNRLTLRAFGTTGVLLAASLTMLAIVSALVAFDAWPTRAGATASPVSIGEAPQARVVHAVHHGADLATIRAALRRDSGRQALQLAARLRADGARGLGPGGPPGGGPLTGGVLGVGSGRYTAGDDRPSLPPVRPPVPPTSPQPPPVTAVACGAVGGVSSAAGSAVGCGGGDAVQAVTAALPSLP